MNRATGFAIASVLSLAVLLDLALGANVEEELKKLETEHAAAVVKAECCNGRQPVTLALRRLLMDELTTIASLASAVFLIVGLENAKLKHINLPLTNR